MKPQWSQVIEDMKRYYYSSEYVLQISLQMYLSKKLQLLGSVRTYTFIFEKVDIKLFILPKLSQALERVSHKFYVDSKKSKLIHSPVNVDEIQ